MINNKINEHEYFMKLAIEQANLGKKTPGGGEVGCVIVKDGNVVATGFNESMMHHDPTAHSEIVTMRKLGINRTKQIKFPNGEDWRAMVFEGHTLYCTLQPCGMCTIGMLWANIGKIIYGAKRSDVDDMYFEEHRSNTVDFINESFRDNP